MPYPRIAFMVLAHADQAHLERLCIALRPHPIFVHIDRKAKGFTRDSIAALPGVTLVTPSIEVHWGDFSMNEAALLTINAARQCGRFDRYVWLSGGCYPVKPMLKLEGALCTDKELMTLTPIKKGSHLSSLIERHWRMVPFVRQRFLDAKLRRFWNRASKVIKRNFEQEIGMTPYYGNSWWALTDQCVSMMLDYIQSNPNFLNSFRTVYAADEIFFHTIVGNSRFRALAIPVEDIGPGTNQLTPLHLLSRTQNRVFGSDESEFEQISNTEKLFIRKVSTKASSHLLDRIDSTFLAHTDLTD